MARPRFNGRGYTNPLNPLGLHSENRHREAIPLGKNFMSNEANFSAEMRVFEAGASALVKGGIKAAARAAMKIARQAAEKAGATKTVAKAIAKRVYDKVLKAGDDAAETAAKAGKEATEQADAALKAMDGAVDDVAGEGIEAGTKSSMKGGMKGAMDDAVGEGVEAGTKKGRLAGLTKAAGGVVAQTAIPLAAAYVLINVFGGEGPIADFFDDLTGANCDAKAEQKYGEDGIGSDEYEDYVEKCHDDASKKMMAFSAMGVLVIGGLLFALMK